MRKRTAYVRSAGNNGTPFTKGILELSIENIDKNILISQEETCALK